MNSRLSFSFNKSKRLRTSQQYRCVIRHSFKFTGQWIMVDIRPTQGPSSRLGLTVTKKFGSAVQRNRFKRISREAFRLSYLQFENAHFDLVIRPRSRSHKADMHQIQEELIAFIHKAIHLHSELNSS